MIYRYYLRCTVLLLLHADAHAMQKYCVRLICNDRQVCKADVALLEDFADTTIIKLQQPNNPHVLLDKDIVKTILKKPLKLRNYTVDKLITYYHTSRYLKYFNCPQNLCGIAECLLDTHSRYHKFDENTRHAFDHDMYTMQHIVTCKRYTLKNTTTFMVRDQPLNTLRDTFIALKNLRQTIKNPSFNAAMLQTIIIQRCPIAHVKHIYLKALFNSCPHLTLFALKSTLITELGPYTLCTPPKGCTIDLSCNKALSDIDPNAINRAWWGTIIVSGCPLLVDNIVELRNYVNSRKKNTPPIEIVWW